MSNIEFEGPAVDASGIAETAVATKSVEPDRVRARGRPLIGLVLGSGAARGFAHIGVIHALKTYGIVPDIIVGTSIGAVVGGCSRATSSMGLRPGHAR